MGIFDSIKKPIFLKEDSEAKTQLAALTELRQKATGDAADKLDTEISRVKAGIYGEDSVRFELENSHIPMLILHDLYLESDGLTAQIDYMIFTRHFHYVVECKNLYGNIEINSRGDFIRTFGNGKNIVKEGIYSPITQNRRHLELIKEISSKTKTNILTKALFEKHFYENYRSIVVIANPKTVVSDKYAKKDVRSQIIRCDQLAEHIRKTNLSDSVSISEKDMMDTANFFLSLNKKPANDYIQKFRELVSTQTETSQPNDVLRCPKCGSPMIRRKATKGANAGKEFWGCSQYPSCRGIVGIG